MSHFPGAIHHPLLRMVDLSAIFPSWAARSGPEIGETKMLITEIAAKFPEWSRVTVAEAWLARFAKEVGAEDVAAEFGFEADSNGEYAISAEEAEAVWSHSWPHGL